MRAEKKKTLRDYKEDLINAVDGWFNKTQDKHGDNPEKMALYQIRMALALKNIKRLTRKKPKARS